MTSTSDKAYRDDLIRGAKAAKRLTNPDVARMAGLSIATVSAIMNGRPEVTLPSLQAVAFALGLDMHDLFVPEEEGERVAVNS